MTHIQPPLPPQHTGLVAVAGGVVDSLRSQPLLLVVILLNCLMIGVAAWVLRGYELARHDEWILLLNKCIGPVRGGGGAP